jgi:hypothetical protein
MDKLNRDDRFVGGLAILLAVCLLFFPWFSISVSIGAFSASATYSATSTPDGWLGILALIAALAVIADVALERFSPQTQVPEIGGSRESTRFVLAGIAAGFVALKFLFHVHFDLFGWGFYVTVVVTAALVFFAAQARMRAPAGASMASPARPPTPAATTTEPPVAARPVLTPDPPVESAPAGAPEPPAPTEHEHEHEPEAGAGSGAGGSSQPPAS